MSQRYSDVALLDAARSCVAERGVSRTTVSDVARRAGASRMTVYRSFPDAATLWSSLLTREIGDIIATAQAQAQSRPTARERLIAATLSAVAALRHDPVIRRVIETDGPRLLPYLTVRRGHAQEIALAAVRHHLAEGRRDGSVRELDEAAAARLVELVVRSLVTAGPDLIDDALTPAIDAELGLMLDASAPAAGATVSFAGSLNAAQRSADLARLAGEPLDVLVIGGGITGVGVALDAASRGLRCGLVERRDLANGTSRWSSKLVHGGLRYLRHLQVDIAWESARERHVLMTVTAPHLVRPLPFVAALNDTLPPAAGLLTEVGVRAGDLLRLAAGTRRRDLPGPRRISALEAERLIPALRADDLRGGVLFWDGQLEDDARLVVAVARTAAARGAAIVTHCSALEIAGERVTVRDELTGRTVEARARTVVNAAGVWAGSVDPSVRLRPSKGAHLVLDAAVLGDPRAALIVPVAGESARWVGATPTGDGRVIVGVTDDEHRGPISDEPRVTAQEEAFLLDTLSRAVQRRLTPDDVLGSYAGFRPLLDTGAGSTADISRRHAIIESTDGRLLTLVGGKLTTYRRMAQDLVDRIVARHGGPPSRTGTLPLVGADLSAVARPSLPPRLVSRYGGEAAAVAALAGGDSSLLEPLFAGTPVLGIELVFGVHHEGAMDVDDLLDRRVRLGLVPAERRRAEAFAARLLEGVAA